MSKFVSPKIKMKSSARLASVQANYMIALSNLPVDVVIEDFVQGKVGRVAIVDGQNDDDEKFVELGPIDTEYFEKLVRGIQSRKEDLEKLFKSNKNSFALNENISENIVNTIKESFNGRNSVTFNEIFGIGEADITQAIKKSGSDGKYITEEQIKILKNELKNIFKTI